MTVDIKRLIRARQLCENEQGRKIREKAGLSTQELANAIGVNPASLNRWERGLVKPTAHWALIWLDAIELMEKET